MGRLWLVRCRHWRWDWASCKRTLGLRDVCEFIERGVTARKMMALQLLRVHYPLLAHPNLAFHHPTAKPSFPFCEQPCRDRDRSRSSNTFLFFRLSPSNQATVIARDQFGRPTLRTPRHHIPLHIRHRTLQVPDRQRPRSSLLQCRLQPTLVMRFVVTS